MLYPFPEVLELTVSIDVAVVLPPVVVVEDEELVVVPPVVLPPVELV